jgi:hypothetical protein
VGPDAAGPYRGWGAVQVDRGRSRLGMAAGLGFLVLANEPTGDPGGSRWIKVRRRQADDGRYVGVVWGILADQGSSRLDVAAGFRRSSGARRSRPLPGLGAVQVDRGRSRLGVAAGLGFLVIANEPTGDSGGSR